MKFVSSQIGYFLAQPETRRNVGALLKYLAFLAAVIVAFTLLFHLIMTRVEGQEHSWATGLYWTLTVMSTLGFGDITFTSDIGRLFSSIVLLSGIFLLLVLLPFIFIRFFYAPWLEARIQQRAPRRAEPGVRGHVIICGYDSIAPDLAEALSFHDIPYHIIEEDAATAARMHSDGLSVVFGEVDASSTYEALRVRDARMVVANRDDATNTNITLTVRDVAPDVSIAAFATDHDAIDVLQLSGATHVLPLREQLGEQLANRVKAGHTEAHVIGRFRDLVIAEFPVHNTPFVGQSIRESRLREATGLSIIGIWERGRLEPARPDAVLADGTVPVVAGTEAQLEELNRLLVIYDANFNPVLIIGGGRVGRSAARTLKAKGLSVHIVERREEMRARIGTVPDRLILGDAADRDVLRDAGLDEAPSVLLTTHDDATNIYLSVYCRRLNPDLRIVSRVTHKRNIEAVLRAGADLVMSYSSLGVESIISILKGRELVLLGGGIDLFRASVPRSLNGRTLGESGIGARTGTNIIAIEQNGRFMPSPGPDMRLGEGDELVALGTTEQRQAFADEFG